MAISSIVFLSLLAIHSSHAMLFPTQMVETAIEPLKHNDHNIQLGKSGGLTHPTCHRSAITERCALTSDFASCVRSSCSECIAESTDNGFDMYCIRMTVCVCSIIKDASCYEMDC